MKTKAYSVFGLDQELLDDRPIIFGFSPKSALENHLQKKVQRTTNIYDIEFIVEEVQLSNNSYTRIAGKPRLCYCYK